LIKTILLASLIVIALVVVSTRQVKALSLEESHNIDLLADAMKVNLNGCNKFITEHNINHLSLKETDIGQWCQLVDSEGKGFRFRQTFSCDDPAIDKYKTELKKQAPFSQII
jgi:hypothetical protein